MPAYKDTKRGTWFASISYSDAFGKYVTTKKRGFQTKKLAQEYERIALLEIQQVKRQSVILDDLFKMYLEYKKDRTKPRTIYNYQMLYNKQISPLLGKMYVDKITIPIIEAFQKEVLKQGYSNAYSEKIQTVLKSTLRFSVRKLMIDKNPFDYVDYVKNHNEVKKEMLFYTPEDFEKFCSVITNDLHLLLFQTMYWTGMRISELQARTWNDLNFRTRDLRIHSNFDNKNRVITNSTKNGENRIIYVPSKILDDLQALYKECDTVAGFNNNFYIFGTNKPIPHKTVENAKNRYIVAYNNMHEDSIPKIRLHDFRHSHVSYLANNGADAWDISERLGHSKEMVEKTYSHMFPEKRNKMKKLLG